MYLQRISIANCVWLRSVLLVVLVCSTLTALASSGSSAEASLKSLYDNLIGTLEQRKSEVRAKPELLNQLAEELIVPHVDFLRMSKIVLGRYWRKLSKTEQQLHVQFMKTKISTAMIKLYDPDKSFDLQFNGSRQSPDRSKSLVQTTWQSGENGQIYNVLYRLRADKGNWKVYDVSVDGVSVLQSYKSAVADEIESGSLAQYISTLDDGSSVSPGPSESSKPSEAN